MAPEMSPADVTPANRGQDTPFGALKQIDAGLLSVGYADVGPADGRAVLLLHGRPYDIHSYAEVAPVLASAGYRGIVPYLRGDGRSRPGSRGPNSRGGISSISPPNGARPATANTGASLPTSSGTPPRPSGDSATRRSAGLPRPLTTQIMSAL